MCVLLHCTYLKQPSHVIASTCFRFRRLCFGGTDKRRGFVAWKIGRGSIVLNQMHGGRSIASTHASIQDQRLFPRGDPAGSAPAATSRSETSDVHGRHTRFFKGESQTALSCSNLTHKF